MPQLDHVTYLSQYFWLIVFYFALYYGATKFFLPRLSRIMALRQERMGSDASHNTELTQETQHVRDSVSGVVSQAHQETRYATVTAQSNASKWTANTHRDIMKNHYATADAHYIRNTAQELVSQECAYYHAVSQAPLALRVKAMLNTLTQNSR
jgi:F0F1-type ATP synthase membrane subunit b/b'